MTQEDKQLLLKDISARLPYGVKVQLVFDGNTAEVREMGIGSLHDIMFGNAEGVPYLRPMSSITEEEERELRILWNEDFIGERRPFYIYPCYSKTLDFYNSRHFDYRGLIEKGLALEALEGMYK